MLTSACSHDKLPDVPAQELDSRVNQSVEPRLKKLHCPGYALTVIQDGKVLLQQCYGYADLEKHKPVTAHTVFGLSAVTKTFTAAAILLLADQQKLQLSDTLDHYLSNLPPTWQKISIRQLATMTAGIPQDSDNKLPWTDQMKVLAGMPLEFTPGTKYVYSEPSYRLLGMVIEKVTKMPYLTYIKQTFLDPLAMTHTGTTESLATTGLVSTSYIFDQEHQQIKVTEHKPPARTFAAGMLASDSDDIAKYAQALLAGKMLSAKAYRAMWYDRPELPDGSIAPWAFGWGTRVDDYYGGQRYVAMRGGHPGASSSILIVPNSKLIVIGMSNLHDQEIYHIPRVVARTILGFEEKLKQQQDGQLDQIQ
jgi:CubicO group peptidase (beta-lactamase class C family)